MRYVVLSCSLSGNSRSRILAKMIANRLQMRGDTVFLFDARETSIPPFDNGSVFDDRAFIGLHGKIDAADGVFLASPIYNWSLSSTAKQIVEATGATGEMGRKAAWFDKVVTFVCSAGLPHSYMAYNSMAMSMMMDFKCVINPYVIYASGCDWHGVEGVSDALQTRLRRAIDVKSELVGLLSARRYKSDWEI